MNHMKVWHEESGVKVFLCLWQVQKAWLENATHKIKTIYIRTLVLQVCAYLMYGAGRQEDEAAVHISMQNFAELKETYESAKTLFVYFKKTWISKLRMWVKEYRTLPHANQNINAAVEICHNKLKSISRITGGGPRAKRAPY